MKKNTKITLSVVILVAIVFLVYAWFNFLSIGPVSQEALCKQAEKTGWAPVFGEGPIGCDGQLLPEDSPLIDRSRDISGYTCYCHTDNTCWNGKDCVPIK